MLSLVPFVGTSLVLVSASCVALNQARVACDENSIVGIPNPGRLDSVFCWRNWTVTPLRIGDSARLVRSVAWEPDGPSLLVSFDAPLLVGAAYELRCESQAFEAVISAPVPEAAAAARRTREQVILDLAKPERAQDLQGGELGSLQVVAGDYGVTSGAASLYERIVRVVSTTAGEMTHDPDYGMPWRIGGLLRIDALQRYQSRLVARIKQDPDVTDCAVQLRQVATDPSVLVVAVQAYTVDGPVSVETTVSRV